MIRKDIMFLVELRKASEVTLEHMFDNNEYCCIEWCFKKIESVESSIPTTRMSNSATKKMTTSFTTS